MKTDLKDQVLLYTGRNSTIEELYLTTLYLPPPKKIILMKAYYFYNFFFFTLLHLGRNGIP